MRSIQQNTSSSEFQLRKFNNTIQAYYRRNLGLLKNPQRNWCNTSRNTTWSSYHQQVLSLKKSSHMKAIRASKTMTKTLSFDPDRQTNLYKDLVCPINPQSLKKMPRLQRSYGLTLPHWPENFHPASQAQQPS